MVQKVLDLLTPNPPAAIVGMGPTNTGETTPKPRTRRITFTLHTVRAVRICIRWMTGMWTAAALQGVREGVA